MRLLSLLSLCWLGRADLVAAGYRHSCGVVSGTIQCWGDNDPSVASGVATAVPSGEFLQVASGGDPTGGHYACAISTSSDVICWGQNDAGQASPPAGQFVQVATGAQHTCAIKNDGTIECWGSQPRGMSPPAGSFLQVATGAKHSCAIKSNQELFCWGDFENQKLQKPDGKFLQVSAAGQYSCALKVDGSIKCWGDLGISGRGDPPAGNFVQVSTGPKHSCALAVNQTLHCWGSNGYKSGEIAPPAGSFDQVSSGFYHTCAVKDTQRVVCWMQEFGTQDFGQVDPPADLALACPASQKYDPTEIRCSAQCPAGSEAKGAMCLSCEQGRLAATAGTACEACAGGKHSNELRTVACQDCKAGTYSGGGLVECETCGAGAYSAAAAAVSCELCALGRSRAVEDADSTQCVACSPGTYSDVESAAACKLCAAGRYFGGTAALACDACGPGESTGGALGLSSCTPCAAGRFTAAHARPQCNECPAGRYGPTTGALYASQCQGCSVGQYSNAGAGACSNCGAGRYSLVVNASACESCPRGQHRASDDLPATRCSPCSNGRFAAVAGLGACLPCAAGRYGNGTGAEACLLCGPGSSTDRRQGQLECEECAAGRYSAEAGLPQCKVCAGGFFRPATDGVPTRCLACMAGFFSDPTATVCSPCAAGTFANASQAAACAKCEAGRSTDGETGAAECSLCSGGLFASEEGQQRCDPCAAGLHRGASNADGLACKLCIVGLYSQARAEACTSCETGRFANATGATSCALCAMGRSTGNRLGSGACALCTTGRYSDSLGVAECPFCHPGQYSTGNGTVLCIACPNGKFIAEGMGGSRCEVCGVGKFAASKGHASCNLCPAGRYTGMQYTFVCSGCPQGRSSTADGVMCEECGPGMYAPEDATPSCIACAAGMYSADDLNAICRRCVRGKSTDRLAGSASCTDCAPGKYNTKAGGGACTNCTAGLHKPSTGAGDCSACAAGTYSHSGAPMCAVCAPGSFSPATSRASCELCAVGRHRAGGDATACTDCGKGRYAAVVGLGSCVQCGAGRFSAGTGATSCKHCARGQSTNGGLGREACAACYIGRYSDEAGLAHCKLCGAGYVCASEGHLAQVLCPDGGFSGAGAAACDTCEAGKYTIYSATALVPRSEATCLACTNPLRCEGGVACREGYAEMGCSSCAPKHYWLGESCQPCGDSLIYTLATVLVIGTGVGFMFYEWRKLSQANTERTSEILRQTTICGIFLGYLQNASIILAFDLDWPLLITKMAQWLRSIVMLNFFQLVSPECTLDLTYEERTMMYILCPMLLISATQAIISNVISGALREHHKRVDRANEEDGILDYAYMTKKELLSLHKAVSKDFNERYEFCQEAVFNNEDAPEGLEEMFNIAKKELDLKEIGVTVLFMLYTTMSTKTLEPLICAAQADGRTFLVMDPKVECWKGEHFKFALFSAAAFVFYAFVLPFLYRHSIKALARQKYEHHHYWWEWYLFASKLVFSIALCVFSSEWLLQWTLALLMNSILLGKQVLLYFDFRTQFPYFVVSEITRPYLDPFLNYISFLTLLSLQLILLLGAINKLEFLPAAVISWFFFLPYVSIAGWMCVVMCTKPKHGWEDEVKKRRALFNPRVASEYDGQLVAKLTAHTANASRGGMIRRLYAPSGKVGSRQAGKKQLYFAHAGRAAGLQQTTSIACYIYKAPRRLLMQNGGEVWQEMLTLEVSELGICAKLQHNSEELEGWNWQWEDIASVTATVTVEEDDMDQFSILLIDAAEIVFEIEDLSSIEAVFASANLNEKQVAKVSPRQGSPRHGSTKPLPKAAPSEPEESVAPAPLVEFTPGKKVVAAAAELRDMPCFVSAAPPHLFNNKDGGDTEYRIHLAWDTLGVVSAADGSALWTWPWTGLKSIKCGLLSEDPDDMEQIVFELRSGGKIAMEIENAVFARKACRSFQKASKEQAAIQEPNKREEEILQPLPEVKFFV